MALDCVAAFVAEDGLALDLGFAPNAVLGAAVVAIVDHLVIAAEVPPCF